jgi:hypothetical protein
MPIRREFRHLYRGPIWNGIRERVLARAGNRCERCKAPNGEAVERGPLGTWRSLTEVTDAPWLSARGIPTFEPLPETIRRVRIKVGIAHLDQNPYNNADANLAALCDWCHLMHDAKFHAASAHVTRATRKDAARPLLAATTQEVA